MSNTTFIWQRLLDAFRFLPKRIKRLFYHFWWIRYVRRLSNQISHKLHIPIVWIIELLILMIEIVGFGEIYDILTTIFKRSTQPLSPQQLQIATKFYGDSPFFRKVRIDENAKIGTTNMATAYVSGFTINTGTTIEDDVLIHELVHVIQYKKYGLRYITRALYGQNWGGGYNYGGPDGIQKWQQADKELYFFNPEQEAELITDLYLLSQKRPPGYFGRNLNHSALAFTPTKILGREHLG